MIIITGAAGFIGSNLTAKLEEQYPDKKIILCDFFGKDNKWNNLANRTPYNIISPDLLFDYIDQYGSDIEMIFHMGATSSTMETNVDHIIKNNYSFSLTLWNLCTEHNIRFLYASSAATYGDGSLGFDDNTSLSYLKKLRPLNPYGWSKHLFDIAVMQRISRQESSPPQWVGLKFFNVYGPNEYHKGNQQSVVSTLYQKIKKNQPVQLFKSYNKKYPHGGQKRDFIWVDDCVDVMSWFYQKEKISGIFNVGTGKARTFEDLAKAVLLACNKEESIEYFDMPESLRDKYQYFTQAPMEKIRKHGYKKPFTSLEKAVELYIKKYLNETIPYK